MKRGKCYLCGDYTDKLTRDHIQPQCAFNEVDREYVRLERDFLPTKGQGVAPIKLRNIYRVIQPDKPIGGGIYSYTQCKACNEFLGNNYDQHFGEWCNSALKLLVFKGIRVVQKEYVLSCQRPLSIIKRIAAMFFSINGNKFADCHPELSGFVKDKNNRYLPAQYRIYAALNVNDIISHIPLQQRKICSTGNLLRISQIAHPPFVYVLAIESDCPDPRLTDITPFHKFQYDDESSLELRFRIVPTNSCFAGDFRTSGKLVPDDVVVFSTIIEPSYFHIYDSIFDQSP